MTAAAGPGRLVVDAQAALVGRAEMDSSSASRAADLFGLLLLQLGQPPGPIGLPHGDALEAGAEPRETEGSAVEPGPPGDLTVDPAALGTGMVPTLVTLPIQPAADLPTAQGAGTTSSTSSRPPASPHGFGVPRAAGTTSLASPRPPASLRGPGVSQAAFLDRDSLDRATADGSPVATLGAPADLGTLASPTAKPDRGPTRGLTDPAPAPAPDAGTPIVRPDLPRGVDSRRLTDSEGTFAVPAAGPLSPKSEPPSNPAVRGQLTGDEPAPVMRETLERLSNGALRAGGSALESLPPPGITGEVPFSDRVAAWVVGFDVQPHFGVAVLDDFGSREAKPRSAPHAVDSGSRPSRSDPPSVSAAVPRAESADGPPRDEPVGRRTPDRDQEAPSEREPAPEARRQTDPEPRTGAVSLTADRAPVESDAPSVGAREVRTPRPVIEQLVERLRVVGGDGRHELSIRLDPPDLGIVRIQAVMDGHRLALVIHAEGEPARDALAQGLPRLREALAQHGIEVEHSRVFLGLDASPGGDSQRGYRLFEPEPALPRPVRPAARDATPVAPAALMGGVDLWA